MGFRTSFVIELDDEAIGCMAYKEHILGFVPSTGISMDMDGMSRVVVDVSYLHAKQMVVVHLKSKVDDTPEALKARGWAVQE